MEFSKDCTPIHLLDRLDFHYSGIAMIDSHLLYTNIDIYALFSILEYKLVPVVTYIQQINQLNTHCIFPNITLAFK